MLLKCLSYQSRCQRLQGSVADAGIGKQSGGVGLGNEADIPSIEGIISQSGKCIGAIQ